MYSIYNVLGQKITRCCALPFLSLKIILLLDTASFVQIFARINFRTTKTRSNSKSSKSFSKTTFLQNFSTYKA